MDINQKLKSYIKDELSVEEKRALTEFGHKTENRLFAEIVDACLKKVKKIVRPSRHLSSDKAENLIIRLLTFNISRADAASFLGNLVFNPPFHAVLTW